MALDTGRAAVSFIGFQHDVCAEAGCMVSQDAEVFARFATTRRAAGALLKSPRGQAQPRHACIRHVYAPGLDRWLRRRGIDHLALSGVVTHYAVLAASLAAVDLGYRVSVLQDYCSSADPAWHETALAILAPLEAVVTAAEFLGG